jgi:hypothetical protein
MLQDEKKHFPSGQPAQNSSTLSATLPVPKVSPIWTKEDIDSLKKGIVSDRVHQFKLAMSF